MNNPNILASQRFALAAAINPTSQAAGSVSTPWLSVSEVGRYLVVLALGVMSTGSTVDAVIEQATSDAGADAVAITGKAITQLTEAGGDSGSQVMLEVEESDLDIANDFTHVRLTITVAAAASFVSASVLGFDHNNYPADHAATVVETVN